MQSTRRGSFSVHRSEKNPRFQIQLDKRPLSPGTSREAGGVPCLNARRGLTLLSPVCRDPAIGVCNQRNPEVPASTGDGGSSNAPNPVECREAPPTSSFPDFSEPPRSEEHTSELQSPLNLVCRLLLEKKKKKTIRMKLKYINKMCNIIVSKRQ